MGDIATIPQIESTIHNVRGLQVILDADLASLYGVETRVLNQSVSRNVNRFPIEFMFQLTKEEYDNLTSQFVISSLHGGRRALPYTFTEQGIAMLSALLRSDTAVQVSINIMNTFVSMRRYIADNRNIIKRLENIEHRQISYETTTDGKIDQLLNAIEDKNETKSQAIFYDGQVYDAYIFVSDLIKSAKSEIILIDNYIDDSVLTLLSKREAGVNAIIYRSGKITDPKKEKQFQLDLQRHNAQYPKITIKTFNKAHDRFLIIDQAQVYHFGASIKDLGKKWFAVNKMEMPAQDILGRL